MSAYTFVKETKGFSITKDGLKVSYNLVSFRGFGSAANVASISFPQFSDNPVSQISVDMDVDTVTIGVTPFAGTATQLIDNLRNNIFIADLGV